MRISELNADQRAAAEALHGGVLVQAGAGSGKTRMLVVRIGHALQTGHTTLDRVLAITFTEKAAGELAERIRADLRDEHLTEAARAVDGAWISTIHGACSRILRENALEIGIDPRFSIISRAETSAIVERAFETAAMELIEHDPRVNEAFGTFGYGKIRGSVLALARLCRLKGVAASEVKGPDKTSPVRAIHALADEAELAYRAAASASGLDEEYVRPRVDALDAYARKIRALSQTIAESPSGALSALPVLEHGFRRQGRGDFKAIYVRLTDAISQARLELVDAWSHSMSQAVGELTERTLEIIADAKQARGGLDFDDLQIRAAELLRTNPLVAAHYRDKFDLVMVDEFQDTDSLQLEIVEAVAGDDLCTVGDPRQSIYRFRGAELEVYEAHSESMAVSTCELIQLADNYRSHADVLGFVNAMFGAPRMFGEKLVRLRAARQDTESWFEQHEIDPDTPRIQSILVPSSGDGIERDRGVAATEIARRLRSLVFEHGVAQRDIVVLLPTYTAASIYASALQAAGLRPIVLGGSRFLSMPEVLIVERLARAIANPEDEEALGVVLASNAARLSDDALLELRSIDAPSLWEALRASDSGLMPADRARADAVVAAIETARTRLGVLSLGETLLEAVETLGYDLVLLANGDEGREGFINILKLLRLADECEAAGNYGPAAFADYIELKRDSRDVEAPASIADDRTDAIRLMSIHASKGLEFPVVVVPELGGGGGGGNDDAGSIRVRALDGEVRIGLKAPAAATGGKALGDSSFQSLDEWNKRSEIDEDKRVLYVALTRAREMLITCGIGSANKMSEAENGYNWLRAALGLTDSLVVGDAVTAVGAAPSVRCAVTVMDTTEAPVELGVAGEVRRPLDESACEVPEIAHHPVQPPRQMAYTHLALYERCPQRFYAERVAGIRPIRMLGGPSPTDFGDAVHRAMEIVTREGDVDAARIDGLMAAHGIAAAERARMLETLDALRHSSDVARALESGASPELPFAVLVGDYPGAFLLQGSMDLVARTDDGTLIVDYKTGTSGEPEALRQRYRLQANCYAYPALKGGDDRVRVAFVRPEVIEGGQAQRIVFDFGSDDLPVVEAELTRMRTAMDAGCYERRAEWDEFVCGSCILAQTTCDVSRA